MKLKFAKGNSKLDKTIYTFSLPAGKTCPGADICWSRAIKDKEGNLRIKDGPKTKFRCFAASQEILFKKTFAARAYNLSLLRKAKTAAKMADLIISSIPSKARFIRVHVSGDFFNQNYFDAWMKVARKNPNVLFYAYTKSVPLWAKRIGTIPNNFKLTASIGGKFDSLIEKNELKSARVVYSEEEAARLGLEIDHDDSLAMGDGPSFALLLHGTQPKGSEAGKAWQKLKENGTGGYSKGKKRKLQVI